MAIGKFALAMLRAFSYPELDIKKNYKLERQIVNVTHHHALKPFYQIWDHVVPCGDHEIPVRIFAPTAENVRQGVLLFFHGGGWVTGNIDSYNRVCVNMARLTGHVVVSVDYQLAPEHKFPAAPEDCYAVAREIFLDTALFNTSTQGITLIGDSAGANLAAAVSLMAKDRGEFMPSRQILIYPSTYNDHTDRSLFDSIRQNGTDYLLTSKRVCDYMELYKSSDEDLKNPYFAPLLAKSLSGQPNTLMITAEYDPLRDEGEAYAEKLKKHGSRVESYRIADALHGYFSLPPSFPQVKESYEIINRFLSEVPQIET